jgi:hypothetical protein
LLLLSLDSGINLFRLNVLLGSAFFKEAKVNPEKEASDNEDDPRKPNVDRGRSIKDKVSSTVSVLP